jgi:hypothetical protein
MSDASKVESVQTFGRKVSEMKIDVISQNKLS